MATLDQPTPSKNTSVHPIIFKTRSVTIVGENGFIATEEITNAYFEKLKKHVNYDISSQKDQCANEIIGTETTTKFWNIRSYN